MQFFEILHTFTLSTNRQSVPDAYVETLNIDKDLVKNHSAMLNDHFKQIETYQVNILQIQFLAFVKIKSNSLKSIPIH